jgi:hypothetical protein
VCLRLGPPGEETGESEGYCEDDGLHIVRNVRVKAEPYSNGCLRDDDCVRVLEGYDCACRQACGAAAVTRSEKANFDAELRQAISTCSNLVCDGDGDCLWEGTVECWTGTCVYVDRTNNNVVNNGAGTNNGVTNNTSTNNATNNGG